jgi:hypothetical protein
MPTPITITTLSELTDRARQIAADLRLQTEDRRTPRLVDLADAYTGLQLAAQRLRHHLCEAARMDERLYNQAVSLPPHPVPPPAPEPEPEPDSEPEPAA